MPHNCPILNRSTAADRSSFSRDQWEIVQCRETGFVYLANPPEYEQLEVEFAWEETSKAERQRRESAEPLVSRVSAFAKLAKTTMFPKRNKMATVAFEMIKAGGYCQPLTVLDIGCGGGNLLVEIHDRFASCGQDVGLVGIEVSRHLAAETEKKLLELGGGVICANAIDGVASMQKASVQLALMSSFLEHERQPLLLLQGLRDVLSPGGMVVLKVPNFASWNRVVRGQKWCGFRFPDHVNYFTPTTLQRLAQEAGFAVLRQNTLDKFPLSDNMYAVLKKTD